MLTDSMDDNDDMEDTIAVIPKIEEEEDGSDD